MWSKHIVCWATQILSLAYYSEISCLIMRGAYNIEYHQSNLIGIVYPEYCADETFSPQCDNGNLILMKSAQYGRMKLGKCVLTDFGYLGCKANVLAAMDSKCSGQGSCDVFVTDSEIQSQGGCIKGLQSYLEVEYRCVEGFNYVLIFNLSICLFYHIITILFIRIIYKYYFTLKHITH